VSYKQGERGFGLALAPFFNWSQRGASVCVVVGSLMRRDFSPRRVLACPLLLLAAMGEACRGKTGGHPQPGWCTFPPSVHSFPRPYL